MNKEEIIVDFDKEINKLQQKTKKQKERIRELERQIKIKDNWCYMIYAIGFDYDGYNDAKNLKGIIDELVDYANKAMECDDKSPVYSSLDSKGNETKENILFEEVGGSNE